MNCPAWTHHHQKYQWHKQQGLAAYAWTSSGCSACTSCSCTIMTYCSRDLQLWWCLLQSTAIEALLSILDFLLVNLGPEALCQIMPWILAYEEFFSVCLTSRFEL